MEPYIGMEKEEIFKILERGKYLEKDKLKFDSFKLFDITRAYFEKKDFEEVFVLECNNKRFEYWISQDLLIPPWETHWFQLKDNFLLKLENELLLKLIKQGIRKSGNLNKFCREIKMSVPTFYNVINKKNIEMISVIKLRKLLSYLKIRYKFINKKIECTRKGNIISIEHPHFPILLNNSFGAALLGMVISDGCIYADKKARNCNRTKYSSGEKESVDNFTKIVNKIYGKTHIQKEFIRNCSILKIGSSIIGDSLLKVGAILGHKAKKNGNVPWIIEYGDLELKRNYLRAIFEDESSIYFGKYSYLILTRYRHLRELTEIHKSQLRTFEDKMNVRSFPTGHVNKSISIKKALSKIDDEELKNIILNSAPKLLLDEAKILREFGIDNRVWGRSLNKTALGNYSVAFDLFISRKESILKFYKEIGYSIKSKQEKLLKLVNRINNNAAKTV